MSNAVNNPVILRIKGNVIEKPAEVVPEKRSGLIPKNENTDALDAAQPTAGLHYRRKYGSTDNHPK